jgi:hypothetical protein
MTRRTRRSIAAITALLAASALIVLSAGSVGAKSAGRVDTATAYVAITHTVGSGANAVNYAAGNLTDKILGDGAVTYKLKVLANPSGTIHVNATKVAVFTSTGSLTGTASGTLTITNTPKTGDATLSNGKVTLTHGTGAQKGHSFTGTFQGTGNVSSGIYKFTEKGTYK